MAQKVEELFMSNKITGLFERVLGWPYEKETHDDHILVQKNTYLLGKLGVETGGFWFFWDDYGPYSPELSQVVLAELKRGSMLVTFSSFVMQQVEAMKRIIAKGEALGQKPISWLELIGSLHYLKHYKVMDIDAVIPKLESLKPQFANRAINEAAFEIVNKIDLVGGYDDDSGDAA